MSILGALLAVVMATGLTPVNFAEPTRYRDAPAIHIWSVDYYRSLASPAVRTRDLRYVLNAHAGQQVQVCVRSGHTHPGTILVTAPRLVGAMEFPHGTRLRTRCMLGTVVDHPRQFPGVVEVAEGTYPHLTEGHSVHGWVRNVHIREVVQ